MHIAGGTAAVPDPVGDEAARLLHPATCGADDAPPTVAFTAPDDGVTITRSPGGIQLTGTASDADSGVRTVEIVVDGTSVGATVGDRSTDPLQWSIELAPHEDREYTFTAVATDGAGNTATDELSLTLQGWGPGDTVVDDDVHVIDDGAVIDEAGDDQLIFGTPPRDPVVPGDILVAGILPGAPRGFVREVVTAEHLTDGRLLVRTRPAQLTDVFWHVDVNLQEQVDPSEDADIQTTDGVTVEENVPTDRLPGVESIPATERPITETARQGADPETTDESTTPPPDGAFAQSVSINERVEKSWRVDFDKDLLDGLLRVHGHNEFGVWTLFRLRIVTHWGSINPFDDDDTRIYVDEFAVNAGVDEDFEIDVEASGASPSMSACR